MVFATYLSQNSDHYLPRSSLVRGMEDEAVIKSSTSGFFWNPPFGGPEVTPNASQ